MNGWHEACMTGGEPWGWCYEDGCHLRPTAVKRCH
jgi:hypothetical protein